MLLQDSRGERRAVRRRRPDSPGRPGPLAVESRIKFRGGGAGRTGAVVTPLRPLYNCRLRSPPCMRRLPRPPRRTGRRSSAVRSAAAGRAVAGRRVEPRRGGRDARRPAGGSGAYRRDPSTRRSTNYHLAHSARAELCRRWDERPKPDLLRTGSCSYAAGAGAQVSEATPA
jgi:hypothetical protein